MRSIYPYGYWYTTYPTGYVGVESVALDVE
jgi:hypothetical protein